MNWIGIYAIHNENDKQRIWALAKRLKIQNLAKANMILEFCYPPAKAGGNS